jgi:hypothetical protein
LLDYGIRLLQTRPPHDQHRHPADDQPEYIRRRVIGVPDQLGRPTALLPYGEVIAEALD